MKTRFEKSLMFLAVLVFVGCGNMVFAQGKKDKEKKEEIREMRMEKKAEMHEGKGMMGIKDLTEDQIQKLKKLRTSHKKEMMQFKNQLAEKKAHMKTLETADNADMSAINKTIDEMGVIKTEMLKKKATHKQEVRKILTDEQRLQFDIKQGSGKEGKGMQKMRRHRGGPGMEIEKEIRIIKEDND